MRKNIKKILALFLACAMLLCCSACQSSSSSNPEDLIQESTGGQEISRSAAMDNVFSLNSHSGYSLNPLIATNHSNQLVCSLVYENMVEINDNFEVIPNIITEWKYTDDEGKNWEFTISPDHTFHDGTTVTAQDVRYSLEAAIFADRYSGRISSYQGGGGSGETLYVTLGVGDTQFIKLLNIPVIKSGTYGEPRPTGSGPYTYSEDGTSLVAYEGYPGYDSLPVDTVYIKEYQTADSIISAFEDSLIDVVINDPSSTTNLGYASTNEVHNYATTNMHYVAFNTSSAMGRLIPFRVAMQYAFDRSYLVELLSGNGVASALPMYPTCAEYPESLNDSLSYNLENCVRILESTGIRDYDDDGLLEYMSGTPQEINLRFIVSSDSSSKAGMVRRFASDMESIGLTVTVQELPWDEFLTALEEGEFDMYYAEVKLRNNFDLTELVQVRDEDNEETNLNFTGSTDVNFENYVQSYLSAGDAGRSVAFQNLCDYLCNTTGFLITIGFEKQQIITHRGVVRGLDANVGNPLYNFQNWTIELD